MAINNKPAETYVQPHTMTGSKVDNKLPKMSNESGTDYLNSLNVSVGTVSKGNYAPTKTSGIEVRGRSKQSKGKLARGPMA